MGKDDIGLDWLQLFGPIDLENTHPTKMVEPKGRSLEGPWKSHKVPASAPKALATMRVGPSQCSEGTHPTHRMMTKLSRLCFESRLPKHFGRYLQPPPREQNLYQSCAPACSLLSTPGSHPSAAASAALHLYLNKMTLNKATQAPVFSIVTSNHVGSAIPDRIEELNHEKKPAFRLSNQTLASQHLALPSCSCACLSCPSKA